MQIFPIDSKAGRSNLYFLVICLKAEQHWTINCFVRTTSLGQGRLMHLLSCLWWHGSGGRPPFIGHVIHGSSWGPAQRLTRIKHSFTTSMTCWFIDAWRQDFAAHTVEVFYANWVAAFTSVTTLFRMQSSKKIYHDLNYDSQETNTSWIGYFN